MYSTWFSMAAEKAAGFDWTPAWTLGGVVVTGLFGLGLQQQQRKTAKHQAQVQSVLDLSKWHRDLRRTSYVDCLISYETLRDLIEPLNRALPWPVAGPLSADDSVALDRLLAMLDQRYEETFQKCQVVRLEGPAAISHTAKSLYLAAADFRAAAKERARAVREGRGTPNTARWNSAAEDMSNALEEFIGLAQSIVAVD
jgi:hypothetical protein